MFNAFSSLERIYRDVRPLLVDWVASTAVSNFEIELAERQAKPSPKVMVYGVYNAGKSTLINALAGKALARCDDIPTTDAVTAYSLGDIELLDTPGIDAPIEHEVISREQLEKSDVVVKMFLFFTFGIDSYLQCSFAYKVGCGLLYSLWTNSQLYIEQLLDQTSAQ